MVFVNAIDLPSETEEAALLPSVATLLNGFPVVDAIDLYGDVLGGIGDVDEAVRRVKFKEPAVTENAV